MNPLTMLMDRLSCQCWAQHEDSGEVGGASEQQGGHDELKGLSLQAVPALAVPAPIARPRQLQHTQNMDTAV